MNCILCNEVLKIIDNGYGSKDITEENTVAYHECLKCKVEYRQVVEYNEQDPSIIDSNDLSIIIDEEEIKCEGISAELLQIYKDRFLKEDT